MINECIINYNQYSTTKDEKEEGKKRRETYNTATIRLLLLLLLLLLLRAIGVASFYSKRSFYVAGAVSKESL